MNLMNLKLISKSHHPIFNTRILEQITLIHQALSLKIIWNSSHDRILTVQNPAWFRSCPIALVSHLSLWWLFQGCINMSMLLKVQKRKKNPFQCRNWYTFSTWRRNPDVILFPKSNIHFSFVCYICKIWWLSNMQYGRRIVQNYLCIIRYTLGRNFLNPCRIQTSQWWA